MSIARLLASTALVSALAFIPALAQNNGGVTGGQGKSLSAPGQQKAQGESAKGFAPGQLKGPGESAKGLAPGRQGKASGDNSKGKGGNGKGKGN